MVVGVETQFKAQLGGFMGRLDYRGLGLAKGTEVSAD